MRLPITNGKSQLAIDSWRSKMFNAKCTIFNIQVKISNLQILKFWNFCIDKGSQLDVSLSYQMGPTGFDSGWLFV